MRRVAFAAVALVLGLLVAAGLAEAVFRTTEPPLRVQVVHAQRGRVVVWDAGGVPAWAEVWKGAERRDPACLERRDGTLKVVVSGSSILYGSGMKAHEAWTAGLGERLSALTGRPICVSNHAMPGYTFPTQLAVLEELLAAHRVDLVVQELWTNSPYPYTLVGPHAYNFHGVALGPDGLPASLLSPGPLHRVLFTRSWAYAWLALHQAPQHYAERAVATWERLATEGLGRWRAALGSTAALVVFAAPLDRPFAQTVAEPPEVYAPARAALQASGVPTVDLAALLIDLDVERIRLDTCCHYSLAGQAVLRDRLAPVLAAELAPTEVP